MYNILEPYATLTRMNTVPYKVYISSAQTEHIPYVQGIFLLIFREYIMSIHSGNIFLIFPLLCLKVCILHHAHTYISHVFRPMSYKAGRALASFECTAASAVAAALHACSRTAAATRYQ